MGIRLICGMVILGILVDMWICGIMGVMLIMGIIGDIWITGDNGDDVMRGIVGYLG